MGMPERSIFQTRSLYLLVYDELAMRISSGVWKPGALLPSEQELAAELSVSIGTVRKALAELEGRHLIERRQGRGTFVVDQDADRVCERFSNFCNKDGRRIAGIIKLKSLTLEPASTEEAQLFRLPVDTDCIHIHQIRVHHEHVFMSEHVAMPASLFKSVRRIEDMPRNLGSLAQRHGVILENAVEQVVVSPLTVEAAHDLGRQPGEPALFVRRVVYAAGHRPIHVRSGFCWLNEHTSYRVGLG
ncbi:MAG: GntR family transcriptional regulator [Hyphomicrobiaceae bacterium]|nr:GntR family transcriptional regulator [Hyphomicrobiaceae bacterium]